MSNAKEEMKRDLSERFGECSYAVVDHLFSVGTLDDTLARHHVVRARFEKKLVKEAKSVRRIMEEIACDLGLSRSGVRSILGR